MPRLGVDVPYAPYKDIQHELVCIMYKIVCAYTIIITKIDLLFFNHCKNDHHRGGMIGSIGGCSANKEEAKMNMLCFNNNVGVFLYNIKNTFHM